MAITLRGSSTNAGINGGNVSVTLPGSIAQNDATYVAFTTSNAANQNLSMVTSGYAELADLFSDDNFDVNFGTFRKVQGPTPDSTAQVTGGGNASDTVAVLQYTLAGVDTAMPEDATAATATGINTGTPNPPSIITATDGAWVLVFAGNPQGDVATAAAPSGYGNLLSVPTDADSRWTHVMGATKLVATAGAENPGAFGGFGTNTNQSWAAATVAVRPAITAISATAGITEAGDTISTIGAIALKATLSIAEIADTLSSTARLAIRGAAGLTEAGDTLSGVATLLIEGALSAAEASDALSATGRLPVTGTLSAAEAGDMLSAQGAGQPVTPASLAVTEADDGLGASAALAIAGAASLAEASDTLAATSTAADAPPLLVFAHVGGDDRRLAYERKQREWRESLRFVIDRSWLIANGEIDVITFEPIPPPDYSAIIAGLLDQALSLDRERSQAFIAEQERLHEDEALAVLLLAA